MAVDVSTRLTLAEARAIIDRAVAKAREFDKAAAFVVVDTNGNVISACSMEGAPASSISLSRAKAYLSAMDQRPTAWRAERWREGGALFQSYQDIMPHPIFPGPGGVPIRKNGQVVGAISTGPGVGGIDVTVPDVEGKVNLEDYIISHALGLPYQAQHAPMGH